MNELEYQYMPNNWCKRCSPEEALPDHINFIKTESDKVRATVACDLDISYGEASGEKLDIYGSDLPEDAPLFVFVHGGYWQRLSKDVCCFMAENFGEQGFRTIVVGYDLCPAVQIPDIVEEVIRAVKFCIGYAKSRGSRGIYLAGHSAGAHLAASVFTLQFSPEDLEIIKEVILISGVFDVRPLVGLTMSQPLKLTPSIAAAVSPFLHEIVCHNDTKFKIFVGDEESPVFKEQSQKFHDKLKDYKVKSEMIFVPDKDHFSIIHFLTRPDFVIVQSIVNGN